MAKTHTASASPTPIRYSIDSSPSGKRAEGCDVCTGTVPNSHHLLIMLSSRNVSGVLDSLVSATDVETDASEKRNVREECYHLQGIASVLQVARTATRLPFTQP